MLKWDVDVVVHLQLDQWYESLFVSQPILILLYYLIILNINIVFACLWKLCAANAEFRDLGDCIVSMTYSLLLLVQ